MDLPAPSHWRRLDFISDVHLYDQDLPTFEAWRAYLARCTSDALFILGDLFEVWVGDDILDSPARFERRCLDALRDCTRHRPVFFLPGNRDFLLGDRALQHAGMQRLADPTTLVFGGRRIALTHGDALCTDDLPYQRFRAEVRTRQWQHDFLGKPLAERQAVARSIRQASEARKGSDATYVDVNAAAVGDLMQSLRANVLVHGHTHEGASHDLGQAGQRIVLNDWSAQSVPPRLEVLQLSLDEVSAPAFARHPLTRHR